MLFVWLCKTYLVQHAHARAENDFLSTWYVIWFLHSTYFKALNTEEAETSVSLSTECLMRSVKVVFKMFFDLLRAAQKEKKCSQH